MAPTLENSIVIAVSSRALFDFEEENTVFSEDDDAEYMEMQFQRLDRPARKGAAFSLIKKLLSINDNAEAGSNHQRVEVVLLSRNDPVSGLRVFKSAQEHELKIERGIFTRGRTPFGYLRPLGAKLFLSANVDDVTAALRAGSPAARVIPRSIGEDPHPDEIRIAFDGDGVLFSDEAERVFARHGLNEFHAHERTRLGTPLPEGPLWPLLEALHQLKSMQSKSSKMRIRLGLFTARSAPAHERAIRTLISRQIRIDEAAFLGGLPKGPFLREFKPDIFFDDQIRHISNAASVTSVGHVPYGVKNEIEPTESE
ncbi:5'-nucleotidase [Roseomonas sp. NAR14]|uniref:5'-nucleotidase n=1 Tax=Roseomonas acroporae TaxID=2937791 RepID=A0A9X1YC69_9PROT|nr:5'-nucleotidase [Roseomonas acroporae]MCK8783856.1 5'-nucleotidase [Roseomonas acroporae]